MKRIIFVGDQRQHLAIAAGRPIVQMQEAGLAVARLDTIRRQRDPELRAAVTHASKGEIAESLAVLERPGEIRELANIELRRKEIARAYASARERGERVLVSPANEGRRELHEAIRDELIERGHVAPAGQEHTILVNRNLSGSQRAMAYNYQEGDVIRFTRGSKQFRIAQGDYARVAAVNPEFKILKVTTAHGRRVDYNPARLLDVEVFRGERRVLARGDRIQFRAPDRALGAANGEFATITAVDDRQVVLRMDTSATSTPEQSGTWTRIPAFRARLIET